MALDIIPKQEGGKLKAVASGTLPSGKPVVVNADGTVSVVEGVAEGAGTPVVFEAASTISTSATYDANSSKVVIAYRDAGNSSYGTAIVGTVSGTSISFGSPVVFESSAVDRTAATYHAAAQKIVIAYLDTPEGAHGTAIVGTVSGTSISFGTAAVFNAATTDYPSINYDASSQKVVIAYQDAGNSEYGTAIVGTVSGTSISFGSEQVFESATANWISATYDANVQKVVIAYRDVGNSSYGTAVVGTVSGTSISFGSPVVFESANSFYIAATYDSNAQKIVISYTDGGNSSYGTAIVGTVSGTSISFGSPVVFESASTAYSTPAYDSSSQKIVVAYRDGGNSNAGTIIVGTVSGTSISFNSPTVFESGQSNYTSPVYDANANKVVIAYQDESNSSYGTAAVFAVGSTNLTSENYIGMSTGGTVADSDNATIDIVGTVNKEQSGLTPGQQYYVQTDGTVGTTPADPSVLAGTAVSATKMVVKS
jgi:hypothetical protein